MKNWDSEGCWAQSSAGGYRETGRIRLQPSWFLPHTVSHLLVHCQPAIFVFILFISWPLVQSGPAFSEGKRDCFLFSFFSTTTKWAQVWVSRRNVWWQFWCFNQSWAALLNLMEARDAPKPPTMHRKAQHNKISVVLKLRSPGLNTVMTYYNVYTVCIR